MKIVLLVVLMLGTLLADRDGGPYIGLGTGISKIDSDNLYSDMIRDTSTATTFYGGAYINKHLSVELAYVSFDTWHLDDGYQAVKGQDIGAGALSVSTLAHYAFFDDALDFYAKFGAADMSFNIINGNGFGMVFGGGMAYRFDETFSMKLAYDMYQFSYDKDSDSVADYRMRIHYVFTAIEMQF